MSKSDESAIIIPLAERDPVLEEKVAYYLTLTPDLPRNENKIVRAREPEGADAYELEIWRREEFRRIKEGHFGMSPKLYFFYNYVKMWDIETGLIRPEYRVCQQEWFRQIEIAQESKEYGVICVKRRRVGASWLMAADAYHDCLLTALGGRIAKVGMTSKGKEDAIELFKKFKFIYDNLPDWLRLGSTAGNTLTSINFSEYIKDPSGSRKQIGTRAEVVVKPPTDTSWEGFALNKWIADECFGEGTLVRMYDGSLKAIENIVIGDFVMGDDSVPRKVVRTCSGVDELYKVEVNKGLGFVCNSKHILTLTYNGRDKVRDIPICEFINKKETQKKYFQLFRKGYDLPKNNYFFDPYWLGLWLGDGTSANASICAADVEIQEYLKTSHIKHNCSLTIRKLHGINFNEYRLNNKEKTHKGVRYELKKLNLLKNKHIPEEYLNTSLEDRYKLLAGIIDSDGHKDKRKSIYEITFKSEILASDVQKLCVSLGLYCSKNIKIAKMKRKDGTIYQCPVFRLGITGNTLHLIPCLVERKKVKNTIKHVRGRKDPDKTGFTVKSVGVGKYYGFSLKDSPYFLLQDGIVAHNCGKVDNLKALFSMSNEAMRVGTRRVGTPIVFGCVCAGTKVWDNKGNLLNIEDLVPENGILGYNGKGISLENIPWHQPPADKECIRITTNSGRFIECSTDHPILWSKKNHKKNLELPKKNGKRQRKHLKTTSFKEAKDINIGEQIAIIESVPVFGDKKMWEPRLIGWLVGDGTYGKEATPCLANCEPEINEYIYSKFDIRTQREFKTKDGRNYKESRIKGICHELRKIGIYGQTKQYKTLPNDIHSYTKDDICEFIGGLFDTDGYVISSEHNNSISITSAYKPILLELQLLLQKLAIHGKINYIKAGKSGFGGNGHYRFSIDDIRSIMAFHKSISFFVKRKQDKLEQVVKSKAKKKEKISQHAIGLRFERVTKIEYLGLKPIYNLTAGVTNTYIANGIVTHNTAGDIGKEGKDLKEMWYNSDIYKLNKFFFGGWMGLIVDEFGNDLKEEAIRWIVYERKRREGLSQKEYNDFLQQYPLTVQEAFTSNEQQGLGNQMHVAKQLNSLYENPIKEKRGFFKLDTTETVVFSPHPRGSCIIYEDPDPTFKNNYCAGTDPTDHESDKAGLSSLSMFIMKKSSGIEPPKIVFEYTDRPNVPRDFYEQALMALIYYNKTKVLIERNKFGMVTYFDERGYKQLLQTSPQGYTRLLGGNTYNLGYYRTPAAKRYGEDLVEEYIQDHCDLIPSKGLLQELQEYGVKNTDRVDAFQACLMMLKEVTKQRPVSTSENSKVPKFGLGRINGQLVRYRQKDGSKQYLV